VHGVIKERGERHEAVRHERAVCREWSESTNGGKSLMGPPSDSGVVVNIGKVQGTLIFATFPTVS
jgi:hypothetical protein